MKKISKHLISLAIISLLVLPIFAIPVSAQTGSQFGTTEVNTGLNGILASGDPREMVGRIINVALGFLGVIAVVIILMGGFKWMTAGGNEDKVAEAKKLLGAGVIGLAIVLAAWSVANFVVTSIYNATSATNATTFE
ncbi:MAG: pilin [Patescibacteria group bacterium]